MSTTRFPISRCAHHGARSGAWVQIAAPTIIVAMVLALFVGTRIAGDHGNLTGFIGFGQQFIHATRPPSGWLSDGPQGYDGQFFFLQAHDPLLVGGHVLAQMRATGQLFRIQRLGYPLLAFIFAAGRASAIPAALIAVNVGVLLLLTAWFATYAQRRGWSTMWALAVGLAPGMLLPVVRDLSDPLATACVVSGVLFWQARRRWPAALLLAGAVLTREVAITIIAGLALELIARCHRASRSCGTWRAIARDAWPVIVVPTLAFVIWHLYATLLAGGTLGTSEASIPFTNMAAEIADSWRAGPPTIALWDTVYVGLMFAGVLLAIRSICRRVTVLSAAAGAACIGVILPVFGDFWSDTRLSAPLFLLLLVDSLQCHDRMATRICTAASAMSVLFLLGV